jgi:glycerophosphoryl diester phosphodiesterase
VTRSALALRELRDTAPWARRFLSIRSRIDLERLVLDPVANGVVDGVSVRQELLDAPTARLLRERNFVVLAWVVNDAARVNELASYGVDGIVTDNLAIVELLAEQGPSSLLSAGRTGGDP